MRAYEVKIHGSEVNIRAYEVKIRAYEVKSCAYEVNISLWVEVLGPKIQARIFTSSGKFLGPLGWEIWSLCSSDGLMLLSIKKLLETFLP